MKHLGIIMLLSSCSTLPEQPELDTYGMILPVCIFLCRQTQTLADDGNASTTEETRRRKPKTGE